MGTCLILPRLGFAGRSLAGGAYHVESDGEMFGIYVLDSRGCREQHLGHGFRRSRALRG